MAENKKMQMQGFGGIVRYDDEYESKFKLTPVQVIGFVVFVILFVIILKLFWPVA